MNGNFFPPDFLSDSLPAAKTGLRHIMEQRRVAASARNPEAAYALCEQFLKEIPLKPHDIIASYHARGSEMSLAPLVGILRKTGHVIALPVMADKDKPLIFRLHDRGAPLIKNAFGIFEPDVTAPIVDPDVVLVPFLAFDRQRHRLGTGGGYYDRTLPELCARKPILVVGVGFSAQEVPAIPVESHDAVLDRIVTELQVF